MREPVESFCEVKLLRIYYTGISSFQYDIVARLKNEPTVLNQEKNNSRIDILIPSVYYPSYFDFKLWNIFIQEEQSYLEGQWINEEK